MICVERAVLRLLAGRAIFFVYAAHFLRPFFEVIGLSSSPQTGRNIF